LRIGDLQVVNGCQTTRSLWKAASRDAASLLGSYVNLRLIAIREVDRARSGGGLRGRISASTNLQTALIRTDDLWTRPEQERLRLAFAALRPHWFYETKRGAWNLLSAQERARFERSEVGGRSRRIRPLRLTQAAWAAAGAPGEARDRTGSFLAGASAAARSADLVYGEIFSKQAQQLLLPMRLHEQASVWAIESAQSTVAAQEPWRGWVKFGLVFAVYGYLAERAAAEDELPNPFLSAARSARLLESFELWAPELMAACADGFDALIAGMRREPAACRRFFRQDGHLDEIRSAVRAAIRREDRLRSMHGLPPLGSLVTIGMAAEAA